MPCLVGLFALIAPRVAIVLVWIFSDYLEHAYDDVSVLWPILGFLFLPLTTLAYAYAWHIGDGAVGGFGLVLIVVAAIVDLGMLGGSTRRRRRVVDA